MNINLLLIFADPWWKHGNLAWGLSKASASSNISLILYSISISKELSSQRCNKTRKPDWYHAASMLSSKALAVRDITLMIILQYLCHQWMRCDMMPWIRLARFPDESLIVFDHICTIHWPATQGKRLSTWKHSLVPLPQNLPTAAPDTLGPQWATKLQKWCPGITHRVAWHDIIAYSMYYVALQIICLPGFPKSVLPEGAHDGIGVCCAFSGSGHVGHVVIEAAMWQWQMATARFYLMRIEAQLETQVFGSENELPQNSDRLLDYQILSDIFLDTIGVFPISIDGNLSSGFSSQQVTGLG